MRSSYSEDDVTILLKEVTGQMKPLDTLEREKLIQNGRHYSEFLPLEYKPTQKYMQIYEQALEKNSLKTANAVAIVSEKILKKKGKDVVIVSLARAGTPIGILIKRYIKNKYNIDIVHYTISIIRDRGIDKNAMNYILKRHKAKDLQFVDGWIGKGAIINELKKDMEEYQNISAELAVLADPAGLTNMYGTTEDFLIPSSCLNATVSGLFSRTILNDDVIGKDDFHGSVYYENLVDEDKSMEFIQKIESKFDYSTEIVDKIIEIKSEKTEKMKNDNEILLKNVDVMNIQKDYSVKNINFIKPGIGETTRVLLRRIPYIVLVGKEVNKQEIEHIVRLCEEKKVSIVEYPLKYYKVCGIIKNISDV